MISVIDYGIGNLRSAEKAFEQVGAEASLVASASDLTGSDAVVLPGVGSFGRCANALDAGGWREPILEAIGAGVPFLGICVGFQLLYSSSEESPGARGLGVFEGVVTRLSASVKHPQIQWNMVQVTQPTALFEDSKSAPWMYFVHSFAPPVGPETVAVCEYGGDVAAAVEHGSIFGTQFHPEKSGDDGLTLLGRFANFAAGVR